MGSLKKGIFQNGAATIFQKLVRIADQLLLVPFFLTHWGGEVYGEWLTLTIIPSVLAFSDLGFGSAISNSFVLAYAAGDKQKAANLRKSGFWIISASVLLGVLLTVVAVAVCEETGAFDKSHIDGHDAMLAVIFMMMAKLLSFYNQLIDGYFRGVRRAALGSLIGSGNQLLNILIGLLILSMGYGVSVFAFSQLAVAVLYTFVFARVGRSLIDLSEVKGRFVKEDIKDIVKKGMGYMMTPIWQSIYFQGTTFVVRLTLGAEAVAVFNTVRTVCRSVNQFFSIINASIFPELQYEYGQGHIATVHRIFRRAVQLSILIGFGGFVFLAIWGLDIYNWWTQSVLTVPTEVWWTFMVGVLLNAIWWTAVVTYRMTNQPFHFAIASTVTAVISVGLTYVLANFIGLFGAAIGCTVFELVMAVYVLPDSCGLLGIKVREIINVTDVRIDISNKTIML